MNNFYCQRKSGGFDFSIKEWNKAQEEIKTLTPEQQSFVSEAIPNCKEQCESCTRIVTETRIKNKSIRELQQKIMEKIPKYIIKSFKQNGEFIGFLSAYSASGMNQFAPQITQAILFDKKEDCIYSDGQIWELGRGGGKGYYEIEKLIQYNTGKQNDFKMPAFISNENMKVIITVNNKLDKNFIKLFGARHNYLMSNFGNNNSIEFINVECDDNYEKNICGFDSVGYAKVSSLLHDFIKYDLRVISINGEPLKRKIKGIDTIDVIEYEIIEELNPYLNEYVYDLNQIGEHKIEIELKKL